MKKILFLAVALLLGFNSFGQRVLLIYDVINANTTSLKTALETAGFLVTYSQTNQTSFNGSNPSTNNFDAIIHLNGTTYAQGMPISGQRALLDFVNSGGCFIASEWNAYDASRLTTMSDLILLNRIQGHEGPLTYAQVAGQSNHPILASIPASFNFNGGANVGNIKNFAVNPAVVLMNDGTNDAVAYRKFGLGSIVNFNHAGNYGPYNTLSDINIQRLYINSVRWGVSNRTLAFDGANDYVSLGNQLSSNSSYTKEAWVYSRDNTGSRNILSSHESPFWISGGTLSAGNGNDYFQVSSANFPVNKWVHVAVTYDQPTQTLRLYKDGILVSTNPAARPYVGEAIYMGSHDPIGSHFVGMIDNARIWNVARSQAEIQQGRTQDLATGTGLVSSYNFDQGIAAGDNTSIITLTDARGAYNGALNNFDKTNGNTTSNFVSSYALSLPTATTATVSPSSISANWAAPTNGIASSYQLNYSTDATFATGSTVNNIAGNVNTYQFVTNVKPGTTYYYRISAASGTTIGGYSNTIAATTTVLTPPGNALAFDNGQLVDLGTGVALGSNFTQEVWINSTAADGAYHAIMGSGDNNGYTRGPSLYVSNGVSLHGGFGTGADWIHYDAINVLKPNEWNHIAQTFDGNSLKLYVNGEEVSLTMNGNPVGAVPTNNGLVNRLGYIDNHFQGRMDEVRLWSLARSTQEIKSNYSKIVDPNTTGLLAYYDFDQGVAHANNAGITTLYDQTANGHNGTLSNTFALNGTVSNWVGSYALVVPTATAATAPSHNGFTANWTAPTIGTASSYILEYATNATFTNNVGSVTTNGLSEALTNLKPNTTYYYRVSAVSGTEVGGYSNVIAATTTTLAPPGNALHFNPVTLNGDNFVSLNANPLTNATDFTMEAWINSEAANPFARIIDFNNVAGSNLLFCIDNVGRPAFYIQNGGIENRIIAPLTLPQNQWHHLAVTGAGGVWTLYLNGIQITRTTGNTLTPAAVGATVNNWLGKSGYSIDPNFKGRMDEVRIWNVARTATQLQDNYSNPLDPATANLVGYYNFDHGTAQANNTGITTLYDQSVSANNGTLNGFALTAGASSNWVGSYAMVVPTSVSISGVGTNRFTANWNTPTNGAANSYQIEYSNDAAFLNNVSSITVGNVTAVTVENVGFGLTYYVRVRSLNSITNEIGGSSNAVSVTTNALTPTTNALNFDGVDDYISFQQKPIAIAGNSWTIEGWLKTTGINQGIFGIDNGDTNWEIGEKHMYVGAQGEPIFVGWGSDYIVGNRAINDGQWHHIAFTVNAATSVWKIYIDGVDATQPFGNYSNTQQDVGLPNFGKPNYGETNNFFNGSLDQFRFWNKTLSATEVVDGLTKTTPSNTVGLIASYNFSQGIANGNNTTIVSVKDDFDTYKGALNNFAKNGTVSNFVGADNYPMEPTIATAAISVTTNSFIANWTAPLSISATTYELDVATDASFVDLLSAYSSTITGNVNNFEVTGLTPGSTYYYRVRANSEFFGTSANSNSITVTGDKADQTLTLAATNSVTYGVADYALGATSTNSGVALTYNSSDPNIVTVSNTGTVHVVGAGSVTITVTQAGDAQYNAAATQTQNLLVQKKALTLIAAAPDKIYDGTIAATVTVAVSGTVNGDTISASAVSATFNNQTVGINKAVTVEGITIAGTNMASYSFAASTTTAASITARSLVVSATAADKIYDGSASATVTVSDNRIAGDAITVTYAASTFNDQNVAIGKTVTVNGITISGTNAVNYVVNTTATTSASITARNLVVSATATNKVYDGNVIATVGLSDNRVSGNAVAITYTAAIFNDKTVASGKTVMVNGITISGTDAANYTVNATAVTSASITARTLTISATSTDKIYDGSATATVALTDNRVSGDQLTIAYANASFNNANVGMAKAVTINGITVTGLDVNNYTFNTTAATAASITPKALTITADNKSRLQGVANPTLTVSYNGFIAGQNNTNALSTQANITTTATVASTPGAYPITASGAVATNGNYAIAYVGGTLTVNASAVTGISLAAITLYENRPAGTTVGTLSSTSTDPAATFTYTLVAGTGNADNARFTIAGNQIVTAGPLDFEAQASYAIRVRSTTQFGVFAEQTFTINILDVNEAPTLNAVADQTICYTTAVQNIALAGITAGPEAGQTVSMTITTNNPGLFKSLSVTKGNGTAGTFSYGISNGWSGTAIVTITVKDDGGTANSGNDTFTRTFNITVNPLPVVSIVSSVPSNSVSRGETLQLMANAPGAASYSWSNANGIISGQNSANLTIKPTQTTTYTVTAFNSTGCSESKQITIEVRNDFFAVKANNILTPNGDGANDTWIITHIDQYPNAEVKVFDRAGRIVFQRKGYDNSWNGSFNGTPLNEGAYLYVIDFGSGLFKAKGTVTILHNN